MDITTLALAKAYAKQLFESGSSKGSSVSIASIVAIEGGNRITFLYTAEDGTPKTETLDVMDGKQGASITKAEINANKQLILTMSDNTTVNAGTVPYINGNDGKDGKDGSNGKDGADGISVTNVQINESNHLTVTLSNSNVIDAGLIETIAGKDGSNGKDGIDGTDGISVTAITFVKDDAGMIVSGTATLSNNTEIVITIV